MSRWRSIPAKGVAQSGCTNSGETKCKMETQHLWTYRYRRGAPRVQAAAQSRETRSSSMCVVILTGLRDLIGSHSRGGN